MSLADSEAAFEQHCKKIEPTLHALLHGQNVKILGSLAFAIGTPQTPPADTAFRDWATLVNGGVEPDMGVLAGLRRLHFEASAMVIAELKSKVTSDVTSDQNRKLPVAEKAARLKDQETRLAGLKLRGELQPSYALIDMVANIKETNCIIWIPPSKCSKRDSEIQQSMKEKPLTLSLEQQLVKVASNEQAISVDTSTDIQLQWALQRRGLAFDHTKFGYNIVCAAHS